MKLDEVAFVCIPYIAHTMSYPLIPAIGGSISWNMYILPKDLCSALWRFLLFSISLLGKMGYGIL